MTQHYNEQLANEQGLTEEERVELNGTYEDLIYALKHPEAFKDIEKTVSDIEFRLQRQWKFGEDARFHRYQEYIVGCTCPRFDNRELIGYSADRYRVSDCPWHWKGEVK
uniref:Uncharacterized protein n=2 Tax=unclassified bacterial viruses TaxID=12333 RepID=A0AAU6VY48_9VIRU